MGSACFPQAACGHFSQKQKSLCAGIFLNITLRHRNRTPSNESGNVMRDSCEDVFAPSGENAAFKASLCGAH